MRTTNTILVAGGVLLSLTVFAQAQEPFGRFGIDAQRMSYWPQPFQQEDRALVTSPFEVMKKNGWQLQNTLGTYDFDPRTQQLTYGGQMKLWRILTQPPPQRRTAFVLNTANAQINQARAAAVRQVTARMFPTGPQPSIAFTDIEPLGSSGEYYDHIGRKIYTSGPEPRLPDFSGLRSSSFGGQSSVAGSRN